MWNLICPFKVGILLTSWLVASNSHALPLLAIDLDTSSAGIQSTITAELGETVDASLVLVGDGSSRFDTLIVDVLFNDMGPVLSLNDGPIAGTLAELVTEPNQVNDIFSLTPVSAGDALSVSTGLPGLGFAENMGYVGLQVLSISFPPSSFPVLDDSALLDIFDIRFRADDLGISAVHPVNLLGPILAAFPGVEVPVTVNGGTVTVVAPAPVPISGSIGLLISGLSLMILPRRGR